MDTLERLRWVKQCGGNETKIAGKEFEEVLETLEKKKAYDSAYEKGYTDALDDLVKEIKKEETVTKWCRGIIGATAERLKRKR